VHRITENGNFVSADSIMLSYFFHAIHISQPYRVITNVVSDMFIGKKLILTQKLNSQHYTCVQKITFLVSLYNGVSLIFMCLLRYYQ
jgi:hypothetical protein